MRNAETDITVVRAVRARDCSNQVEARAAALLDQIKVMLESERSVNSDAEHFHRFLRGDALTVDTYGYGYAVVRGTDVASNTFRGGQLETSCSGPFEDRVNCRLCLDPDADWGFAGDDNEYVVSVYEYIDSFR